MSKSTWKWWRTGGLVAVAGLGTSAAVAMGFWLHPAASRATAASARSDSHGGIPGSDSFALVEQLEPAPLYKLTLPTLSIVASPGREVAPPWDPRLRPALFPRIEDKPGPVAGTSVRNPGVAIRESSLARKRERTVPQRAPQTVPVVSPVPPPKNLASELKEHRREIDRCAGREIVVGGALPPPTGKIAVRWVVRSDGKSDQVEVQENTVDDKKLSKCVLNAVNHWRFSPPAAGDAHVQSTFVFL